ncbi:phosphate ABC transporter substrate-binding protein [Budviciaceae bacterium CWB-B4]|uniref:Phosphate-binding protein n=1 Tax=Limnobaculum xujianqingii TaxID=2738837 RepID=A0A9D7AHV7_9GAMM|nr:phosphate ABC transporter substrate-binding protein [Limnobaculum xujianqingii]MBK5072987.1 phosphate ABC transporter substrate-binding protein [Limnobaculum xujianqingii]MBK5176296.1 phosphate ABC transporter substrate-binding protein [Limnobaculum xujianqingii]
MNRYLSYIAAAFICLSSSTMASPLDAFKEAKGNVNIAGGTAHVPVMVGAAKNIMSANPNVNITVTGGGSGVGVQKVGEGLVDIGNTGRALKQSEVDKYGLVTFPFAIDGVAVVVNDANSVKSVSREQLSEIFAGKISNWKQLGGTDAAISLYVREDGSGTREVFEEKALNKGTEISRANVVNSNGAMKTAIVQDKNAIGYVGIGHLDNTLQGLTIDGMVPSQENAANGSYKVTRLLYMNTKGQPQGLTKAFIEYIYSPEGTLIIEKSGYLPTGKGE